MSSLCPNWSYFSNHLADPDGRIILICRNSLNVQILHQTRQCITCKIDFPNQPSLYYSEVYASNLSAERTDLWAEIIHLSSTLSLENTAWTQGGDLNQIIYHSEYSAPTVNALIAKCTRCVIV